MGGTIDENGRHRVADRVIPRVVRDPTSPGSDPTRAWRLSKCRCRRDEHGETLLRGSGHIPVVVGCEAFQQHLVAVGVGGDSSAHEPLIVTSETFQQHRNRNTDSRR